MNTINENCLALSFHKNKVFLTLDHCSLTLRNFILTLENLGPRVNDSWDSDPSENPVASFERLFKFLPQGQNWSCPRGPKQKCLNL